MERWLKETTKLYQKISFVSATKIDENTTNIYELLLFKLNSHLGPSSHISKVRTKLHIKITKHDDSILMS